MVTATEVSLQSWLADLDKFGPIKVIREFADAGREIAAQLREAPLRGSTGLTGEINVQGEEVAKLDVFANDRMKVGFERSEQVHACVSEEEELPTFFGREGKFDVFIDPLDGSSNIDMGINVGAIIAIYRQEGRYEDVPTLLRPGRQILAAAYINFGTCVTMVIVYRGHKPQGFTLFGNDYFLSHPGMVFPRKTQYVSNNWAYESKLNPEMAAKMRQLSEGKSGRYIGGLVPDFHRNLIKGGVFAYPADVDSPEGKLRLTIEANPMAFIAEAAGGAATDGRLKILDLVPTGIHQRTPLIIGPREDVAYLTAS